MANLLEKGRTRSDASPRVPAVKGIVQRERRGGGLKGMSINWRPFMNNLSFKSVKPLSCESHLYSNEITKFYIWTHILGLNMMWIRQSSERDNLSIFRLLKFHLTLIPHAWWGWSQKFRETKFRKILQILYFLILRTFGNNFAKFFDAKFAKFL